MKSFLTGPSGNGRGVWSDLGSAWVDRTGVLEVFVELRNWIVSVLGRGGLEADLAQNELVKDRIAEVERKLQSRQ